jgi:hypothetical protein
MSVFPCTKRCIWKVLVRIWTWKVCFRRFWLEVTRAS